VVFTAHSLPRRILDEHDPYPGQLQETAQAVAGRAGLGRWSIAWQSAGRTEEPWLGPDLSTVIRELRRDLVVCPAGFVSDHLEILYDLDLDARAIADEVGITLRRTDLPNDDPAVCAALADLVRTHA